MDTHLQLQFIFALVFLIFIYRLWTTRVAIRKGRNMLRHPPHPSGALPIIGHIHLLKGQKPLPEILGAMADKYGPIFMLRLGMTQTLVVSNWEAARDCFTTNDKALASRPSSAAGKHMGYDYSLMGFAPYGSYWRSVRKIAMAVLLSSPRVEVLQHARSMEINVCIKHLYSLWANNGGGPVTVEMKKWLGNLSYNFVVKAVAGKRYFGSGVVSDEAWRFRKAISQFFSLFGAFVASDMFPFLKWLDLGGYERTMKSAGLEMDSVMTGLLEEHRQNHSVGVDTDRDFMDAMQSIVEEDTELSKSNPDRVIKATSLSLIMGGTDTTTGSLIWTLAALLNNRWALKRAQEELETSVGRDRLVDESDIKNLVFLQAVVKEAFRLYPVAPLLVPHEAMEDCSIGGFHVPAGTRLLVNIWKLQRDPAIWTDPGEFRPERFLTGKHAGINVRGQHFELIPFGSGRRACPGISFALQLMHLTLARLIQGFELETPGDEPVEMVDGLGSTAENSPPLEVVLTPRLSEKFYID